MAEKKITDRAKKKDYIKASESGHMSGMQEGDHGR